MSTYMTEGLEVRTEAEWAESAARAAAAQRAAELLDVIGEHSAKAYAAGEIDQPKLVRSLIDAAKASSLSKLKRAMAVGYWLMEAEEKPAALIAKRKGPKGAPAWHRNLAVQGLQYATQHGAVISRSGSRDRPSAFEWVAEYLTKHGVRTTPAQVEGWYTDAGKK